MAVEVHISIAVLSKITAEAVQRQLFTADIPEISNVFVDHLDVGAGSVQAIAGASPTEIELEIPIDCFVVTRDNLLSSANAEPPGTTVPFGSLTLVIEVRLNGTALTFSAVRIEGGSDIPGAGPVLSAIVAAMPPLAAADFAPLFAAVGLASPSTGSLEIESNTLAIRFDAQGAFIPVLAPGQDWGMFIDGTSVVSMVSNLIPSQISAGPINAQTTPTWAPQGSNPNVKVAYSAAVQVPDPFTAKASGSMDAALSLIGGATKWLRTHVSWSLRLNFGAAVPRFVEKMLEEQFTPVLAKQLADRAGGTQDGPQSFFRDLLLPRLTFAGAKLMYDNLVVSAAGMTLGGAAKVLPASRDILSSSVIEMRVPVWIGFCSVLAKSGSGKGPDRVKASDSSVWGSVNFSTYGSFLAAELLSSQAWVNGYMEKPAKDDQGGVGSVMVSMPASVGAAITTDIIFILRTSRGVRLINIGHPKVIVDEQGYATNARISVIPDCLMMPAKQIHKLKWGSDASELRDRIVIPPFEDPDWSTQLGSGLGTAVQVVTLAGLEPGELLRLSSDRYTIDITADSNGGAQVPVFLPASVSMPQVTLERVNRRSMEGLFAVKTTGLLRRAVFQSGDINQLEATTNGNALLTTGAGERFVQQEISRAGLTVLAGAGQEASLNPQPLPPEPPDEHPLAVGAGLSGVREIVTVPGMDSHQMAIARMEDGASLLLDRGTAGQARISGAISGNVPKVTTAGEWAMSSVGGGIAVYSVDKG
jgi:hypothetical protein